MSEREHYTIEQLTQEEAERKHIAEQARKYHVAGCVSCFYAEEPDRYYDPPCSLHHIKPEEAELGKCPSFMPHSMFYTKSLINIEIESEKEQMRKLAEESAKRHKEIYSHVRAMRVMARLAAHEVNKKLWSYNK